MKNSHENDANGNVTHMHRKVADKNGADGIGADGNGMGGNLFDRTVLTVT